MYLCTWETLLAQSAGKYKMAALSFPNRAGAETPTYTKAHCRKSSHQPWKKQSNFSLTSWVILFELFGLKACALCWQCSTFQKITTSLWLAILAYKQLGHFPQRKETLTTFKDFLNSFALWSLKKMQKTYKSRDQNFVLWSSYYHSKEHTTTTTHSVFLSPVLLILGEIACS